MMNDYDTFEAGVNAANFDLDEGWFGGGENLDSIVSQLRVMVGASDEFCAGYLSVVYGSAE